MRIILPLTLPGIAATGGFVFTAAWSELLFALMLNSSSQAEHFSGRATVLRVEVLGRFRPDDGGAGVLALIPACLFFLAIQRYLVRGLTAGAVKG